MMSETQKTIAAWGDATFPGGDPSSPRHCLRLLEEAVELCLAAGASDASVRAAVLGELDRAGKPDPAKVPDEVADVYVMLAQVAEGRGIDIQTEVDRKMAINRARVWKLNGDGTGQHVRVEPGEGV